MDASIHVRDRVAVVTGAARGIGRKIAEALAAGGARVGLVDVLDEELRAATQALVASGATALPVVTDVTDPEQVDSMVSRVERDLGPIEILVNNAGTFSCIGPVWEVDPDSWFKDTRVNLYGVFLCCRTVVKGMVARGSGYVVNISTTGGVNDPHPYSTSYACSKTAQLRLTEALAKEAHPHGVKVFAVGPPAILTEMTKFIADDAGGRKWRPGFGAMLEAGRTHPPELVADVVLKLVSGKADRLTGRFFKVTDSFEETVARAEDILANDLLVLRVPGF